MIIDNKLTLTFDIDKVFGEKGLFGFIQMILEILRKDYEMEAELSKVEQLINRYNQPPDFIIE